MAQGTQLYNKDRKNIYPYSEGTLIESTALGGQSTVHQDLQTLYSLIQDIIGDEEAVSTIQFDIEYKRGKTAEERDIEGSSGWGVQYIEPTLDFPYTWKRTTIKTASTSYIKHEIVTVGELTQTIYRAASMAESVTIVYPTDNNGNEILSSFDDRLPTGWYSTPQSLSATAPNVYFSTRTRKKDGTWGRFSTAIQYGRWAFDSSIAMKFKITEDITAPEFDDKAENPGEGWVDKVDFDFTGYLWMISATEVDGRLQQYSGVIWKGPTLLSIVK